MKRLACVLLFLIWLASLCLVYSSVKAQSGSQWQEKVSMPTARSELGVAVVNGKIYAIGGFSSDQNAPVAANEEYDAATNKWISKDPIPTPRYGCAATAFENEIFIFGGETTFYNGSRYNFEFTNITEVYDPAKDSWTSKAAIPIPEAEMQANAVEDKIYLIGGSLNGSVNQVYDPATDSWATKAAIPIAVSGYASAVADNKIFVFSGNSTLGAATAGFTQIYDPKADTWSSGASLPKGVQLAAAGTIADSTGLEAIYVIGGKILSDSSDFFPNLGLQIVQVYFPRNDSWIYGPPMPISRSRLSVAVINDTLYAIGGSRTRVPIPAYPSGYSLTYAAVAYNEEFSLYPTVTTPSPSPTLPSSSPSLPPAQPPNPTPIPSTPQTQNPNSLPNPSPSPTPSPTPTISPIITVTGYAARIHNFSYVGPAPIAFPWVEYNFSLTVQNTGNATITNADLLATLNLSNGEPVKDYFQSIQVNSLSVGETRQVKGGWLDIQNSSLNVSGLNQTWSFVLTTPEGVLDRQTFSRITPLKSPTQQPTAEPSPTVSPTPTAETGNSNLVLEMAGVIVIVIVVVGLLVYFTKRRGKRT